MEKEFLLGLGIETEIADKIFAENNKNIEMEKAQFQLFEEENLNLKAKLESLVAEKAELEKVSGDVEAYKNKLAEFEKKESERTEAEKTAAADNILTNAILSIINEKEFVNDYTKNSILSEIKAKLANGEKNIKKTFDELVKDKNDIFKNPNTMIDIPSIGNTGINQVSEEQFAKMRYADRVQLKRERPEVYKTLRGGVL